MVATHSVLVLEVADDRLDGGPAPELAFDGRGDADRAVMRGMKIPCRILLPPTLARDPRQDCWPAGGPW